MNAPVENPDFLTPAQAAQELDVQAPAVHSALSEGRLPFVTLYGRKLISRTDLDAYKLRTRPGGEKPRGRPRKDPQTRQEAQGKEVQRKEAQGRQEGMDR